MKEIMTQKGTFLFLEVPDDVLYFRWFIVYNVKKESFSVEFQTDNDAIYISLNTNKDCYIISTTKDVTEEQAQSIVDSKEYESYDFDGRAYDVLYKNYNESEDSFVLNCDQYYTAKESLQSLIQANDLDIDKNYLIIKKYENNTTSAYR
jgi:hypothetical protein